MSELHEKRCTKCRELWPADSEFFRPRVKGGKRLLAWCRACETAQKNEKRRTVATANVS